MNNDNGGGEGLLGWFLACFAVAFVVLVLGHTLFFWWPAALEWIDTVVGKVGLIGIAPLMLIMAAH